MVQRLGDREGSTKLEAVKNGNETYTCREGRWNGNETQNVVGGTGGYINAGIGQISVLASRARRFFTGGSGRGEVREKYAW